MCISLDTVCLIYSATKYHRITHVGEGRVPRWAATPHPKAAEPQRSQHFWTSHAHTLHGMTNGNQILHGDKLDDRKNFTRSTTPLALAKKIFLWREC